MVIKTLKESVKVIETLEEANEIIGEMDSNLDFNFLCEVDHIQEVYQELIYQGLDDKLIIQLAKAQYGNVLEIYKHDNIYYVYVGVF